MNSFLLIFLILSQSVLANETTTGGNGDAQPALAPANVPRCIRDQVSIDRIMSAQSTNRKNNNKYDGYREVLRDHEDVDLMARLIYAEVLAAQCPQHNQALAQNIAYVVHNRVREQGRITNVLFDRRDQFASSMNNYGSSQYREFLCPAQLQFFSEIRSLAQGLLSGQTPNPTQRTAVNYYLHRHWGEYQGNPTDWGRWPREARVPDVEAPCFTSYRRP